MANTYDVGDHVRLNASFAQDDSAVDPDTVAVTIRTPDGARTTYTYGTDAALLNTAVGTYEITVTLTQIGAHRYRWVSTGNGAAAEEGWFHVRDTAVNE